MSALRSWSQPINLDLNIASEGAGQEIVFLHGWTLDHRIWRPQSPLSDDYRLIMPDRRGFGRSAALPDIAQEWQDVDELAKGKTFALVGLSQGATVALDYARHRPERLTALVLVGAPLHGAVAQTGAAEVLPGDRYAQMIGDGHLAEMKADWARNPLVRVNDAARPLLAEILADYDGRDLLVKQQPPTFNRMSIASLPMPVLAIAGAADTTWRKLVAHFIGETAPQGQVVLIDNAGHLCNLDNPQRFNAVLSEFLSSSSHEKART